MTVDLTLLTREEENWAATLRGIDTLRADCADPELRDSLLVSHRLVNMRWQQARTALRDATDGAMGEAGAA